MGGPIGAAAAAAAPGAQEEVACLGGPRAADRMGGVSCTRLLDVLVWMRSLHTLVACARCMHMSRARVACSLPWKTRCMKQTQLAHAAKRRRA